MPLYSPNKQLSRNSNGNSLWEREVGRKSLYVDENIALQWSIMSDTDTMSDSESPDDPGVPSMSRTRSYYHLLASTCPNLRPHPSHQVVPPAPGAVGGQLVSSSPRVPQPVAHTHTHTHEITIHVWFWFYLGGLKLLKTIFVWYWIAKLEKTAVKVATLWM